jgi:cell wall-associated NlpC family hydrolase
MDPHAALKRLLDDLVPDRRTLLCEVALQGGTLTGVADSALERQLYRFAAERGLPVRVSYPAPTLRRVQVPRLPIFADPGSEAGMVDEALYGEEVRVFDARGDLVRVAPVRDDYLGWVQAGALSAQLPDASHRFVRLRGHAYAGPRVQARQRLELSYGTPLLQLKREDGWAQVRLRDERLWVPEAALAPLAQPAPTRTPARLTRFALRFLEAPYLWGGVTAWGLDCSGLVQTAFAAFGEPLPRDSDQQGTLGVEVERGDVAAGDLLFFPGHAAIALGGDRFVHANAHHMRVTVDTLGKGEYGRRMESRLTGIRRLPVPQADPLPT